MLRKILVCALILVAVGVSEAAPVKIGLVKFGTPRELVKASDVITETFSKTLAGSDAISVLPRNRADKAINSTSELQEVSSFGRAEGCRYILLGSVRRDRDIVVSVRAVDVQTARVEFSMSVSSSAQDNASLRAEAVKLGDMVREKLTGDSPKVLAVNIKNKTISINRGTSSGVKKGDLYRVYRAYLETMDREGNNSGRQAIDFAVVEVKSIQKSSGTAALLKNGGDPQIIPILAGCKIEAISQTEAKKMIRSKSFSLKTIEKNVRDAENQSLSGTMLNPNFSLSMIDGFDGWDFDTIKQLAENGHPDAQTILGFYYLAQRDFPSALKWAHEAESQGSISAHTLLGMMYLDGLGVQLDYSKAFGHFTRAAERGETTAQTSLGSMYFYGKGVAQDYGQALGFFFKARGQGQNTASPLASLWLGFMYSQGLGVNKNRDTAAIFLQEAAANGAALQGNIMLGNLYLDSIQDSKDPYAAVNFLKQSVNFYNKALEQARREQNHAMINELLANISSR